MILKKKKLFWFEGKRYVDVRSDELERAKKSKAPLRIIVGDEYMDVKRKVGKKITKDVFSMKYPPWEEYTLISFEWKPTGKLTPLQLSLN